MRIENDYINNNYKEQRSKLGNFFYRVTAKSATFLMRHMWLYYLLNYTWGLLATVFGWVVLVFIKLFLNKHVVDYRKFGPCYYIMLFNNWGGLELGINFILANNMGDYWTLHTKCHELGHTFQNAIFGPLAIFMIYLPSAIRYWYQEFRSRKAKLNKAYDSIWFEESATDIGTKYYIEVLKGDISKYC